MAIVAVFLLVFFASPIIAPFIMGISWGLTCRDAEKEIKRYIESFDAESLIAESLPLIEKAKKENALPEKSYTLGVFSEESMPSKWRERKVKFIYFTEKYVDYVWTGGILGRRAIMVRKEKSGLVIEAFIRPEDPPLILYPPKTENIKNR